MTTDEKLDRLIELVERIHQFNRHGSQPSASQLNAVSRELQTLKQTRTR